MERYTAKNEEGQYYLDNGTLSETFCKACNKFGQLEDIEEDFGIDLIKLFTAKIVYFIGWNYGIEGCYLAIKKISRECYSFHINIGDKLLELCDLNCGNRLYLDFSDYGKKDKYGGWAFAKEELL